VAVAAKRAARVAAIPADVAKKLQDGKLEQACPDCGRWEAAGSYCSGCDRPMGPDDWYRNGDLTRRAVARQAATEKAQTPLIDRLWAKVDKTGDCWIWTGACDSKGYGRIGAGGRGGRLVRPHRVVYEAEHGAIPEGMYVCHHCDNPPCVRPEHLFLGTNQDNQLDAVAKGRIAVKRDPIQRDRNAGRAPKRPRGRPRAELDSPGLWPA
jgi:hypothetical protein